MATAANPDSPPFPQPPLPLPRRLLLSLASRPIEYATAAALAGDQQMLDILLAGRLDAIIISPAKTTHRMRHCQ